MKVITISALPLRLHRTSDRRARDEERRGDPATRREKPREQPEVEARVNGEAGERDGFERDDAAAPGQARNAAAARYTSGTPLYRWPQRNSGNSPASTWRAIRPSTASSESKKRDPLEQKRQAGGDRQRGRRRRG